MRWCTRPGTARPGCRCRSTRLRRAYGKNQPSRPARPRQISHAEIDRIVAGTHHDPHSVLGAHPRPGRDRRSRAAPPRGLGRRRAARRPQVPHGRTCTRACSRPRCRSAACPTTGWPSPTRHRERTGPQTLPETVTDDPYRHLPTLGEIDLHLIAEGRHEQLWQVLGAHVSESADGTAFAVWAPNARGVRVIGDFNHWDGRAHPMRSLGGSGVWELFVPEVGPGTRYKYDICGPDGSWHSKADPMAALAERPPATASVVYDSRYEWGDQAWMAAAGRARPAEPADERVRGAHRARGGPGSPTPSSPTSSPPTSPGSGSRTSSSCRSPSTRSADPGATR